MKKYERIPEDRMHKVRSAIFELEEYFPENHPIRQKLFNARRCVGDAIMMNREDKDHEQVQFVRSE